MPYDLEGIIRHVKAQGRPGTHQAVLVGRIEELEAALLGEFHRGMEAAAAIADIYETENFRLAQDTILTDPVLSGRDRSAAAWEGDRRCLARSTHVGQSLLPVGQARACAVPGHFLACNGS